MPHDLPEGSHTSLEERRMKVKDLIRFLSSLDGELPVFIGEDFTPKEARSCKIRYVVIEPFHYEYLEDGGVRKAAIINY